MVDSRGDSGWGHFPTKWRVVEFLGRGSFGNVYRAHNNDTGAECAIKEILLEPGSNKHKHLEQETSVLSKLSHPNIVQYLGKEEITKERVLIVLEFVPGGSIHKRLQEQSKFEEPVIRDWSRQILSALAYLHSLNTVHRDVKCANILVDTNGRVKIADFGTAKLITSQSFAQSEEGTPHWTAPEVFKTKGTGNHYDVKVDIWSLGCTVVELATGKPPWSDLNMVQVLYKILLTQELPEIPHNLSAEGKDFVRRCLERDPTLRPTAEELLEHPFVENRQAQVWSSGNYGGGSSGVGYGGGSYGVGYYSWSSYNVVYIGHFCSCPTCGESDCVCPDPE